MATPAYLNALRAFEASARHGSFSAAAIELNVTAAAVGQQVRNLEAWLGTSLFIRAGRGTGQLELTANAQHALPDIRAAFERLAIGVARLREASAHTGLTITVSPAFASKWLVPRLERFQKLHPSLDVQLDTDARSVDFNIERVDLGVRYGGGQWPGLASEKLMGETLFPVCAPDYPLLRNGKLELDALSKCTLIHDLSMANDPAFPNWRSWLDRAGHAEVSAEHGLRINNSAAVLQAAVERQGLALARSVMVQDDLNAGRLIRPQLDGTTEWPLEQAYYIVFRPDHGELTNVRLFRDWLVGEVVQGDAQDLLITS
ncbi:LysR substrate-binding domain-containing protein [Pseudomonas putida]|uniref:LysR substrate-binding domain-containing protein n=1 Tax=Pseudomonas putida TaxID=303 RepID=UPI002AC7CCF3|nr:LysR substrate-binding domain-containing protein [Pseudomonas putida]MDZ5111281.1 LysR substrate-binding domain-containing protein [Pseudomonas putida]